MRTLGTSMNWLEVYSYAADRAHVLPAEPTFF